MEAKSTQSILMVFVFTRFRLAALVLAALLAAPAALVALDPRVAATQYLRTHWGRAEGIPDTSVFAIAQTRDGYLWLGTEMGLVRFDGARFVLYGASTAPAFETSMVSSLLATRDGALLIGTRTGLIEYRGGEFRRLRCPGGADEAIIHGLFEDGGGRVWVASNGDLWFIEDGRSQIFSDLQGERLSGIIGIAATPDGALWFLDGSRVYRWRDRRFGTVVLPGVSQTIAPGRNGSLWAFPPGRLMPIAGKAAEPKIRQDMGVTAVAHALEDRDGVFWLGSRGGLLRWSGDRLDPVDFLLGGPQFITAFFEDGRGNLWIGTLADGLFCISIPLVRSFAKPEGLDLGYVNSVLEASDGALWIGTQTRGLVRWKDGLARCFGEGAGIPNPLIGSILEDSKDRLWVGTGGGLAQFDGKGRFFPVALPLKKSPMVFSLAELGDESILAGTSEGLFLLRSGRWQDIDLPQGEGLVLAIEPHLQGAWLAALGGGLLYWDGQKVSAFGASEGMPTKDVVSLRAGRNHRLWIGTTNRGLVCYDGKRFQALGPPQGLPEGPIYEILDAAGSLWLSGKAGIARLQMADLEAWLAGREPRVRPRFYGEADGMREAECCGSCQPSGWKAKDGVLWFPTVDGIAQIDPSALARLAPDATRPLLEETLVDGEPAHPQSGAVRLPPGRRRLEIHFTAPAFPSARDIHFEYCLDGFDRAWVQAGSRRVAYYTNLPSGTYRFRVRAGTGDGPWAESKEMLSLVQSPRFYQRWPFILACALLAFLTAYGLHRLRVMALRRRFEAVLGERARISREIHDSLTQSFAGIVLMLEAAEKGWDDPGGPSRERVDQAKAAAREGLQEARRFVRGLRTLHLESEDLPAALQRIACDASAKGPPDVTFRTQGRKRRLPPSVEDNLLRIAQELLSNASRHARAAHVKVFLAFARSGVSLAVEDDGRGFDPSAVATHAEGGYGLRGIQERAEQMKGRLDLKSAPGQGTRIAVTVPL